MTMFAQRGAVSSRGRARWFSATGPGFESPYRYHKGCIIGHSRQYPAERSFSFEPIRSRHWDEPERSCKYFSQQLTPVFDVLGGEQCAPIMTFHRSLTVGFQLRMTVTAGVRVSVIALIRKRWPSGATAYCCRFPACTAPPTLDR